MDLTKLTIDKFAEATASGEPVPGGGSISALSGALAAALGQMVARLTIGKKKYADVQTEMEAVVERLSPVVQTLTEAVDLDSDAYDRVFAAYKLPKETDQEKEARKARIQEALKQAASVPLEVAKAAAAILPDLELLALKGNSNAVTDAYVAALSARTAVLGAGANVRINLMSITDEKFVDEAMRRLTVAEHAAMKADERMRAILMQAL